MPAGWNYPAPAMPGQVAFAIPTMGDFKYIQALFESSTNNGFVLTLDTTHEWNAKWAPGGGGGSGTVTSITATFPIQVTPNPITATGDIEHADSGVTAGTYGDGTNIPSLTVTAKGHVTSATVFPFTAAGNSFHIDNYFC